MIKITIKQTQKLAMAMSVLIGLSGCSWWNQSSLNPANINPEKSWVPGGGDRVSMAGAVQMIEPGFEKIDLVNLLDPYYAYHDKYNDCENRGGSKEVIDGCKIDIAFQAFNSQPQMNPPANAALNTVSFSYVQKTYNDAKNAHDTALEAKKAAAQKLGDAITANGKSNNQAQKKLIAGLQAEKDEADKKESDTRKALEKADKDFSELKTKVAANELPLLLKRNAIQNKLIAASDQRCNAYLNYMQRSSSEMNFGLGFLTTAVGGAGSIVTGATAARVLAGAASILSGTQAEFDQDFYYNQAVNVLLRGITEARKEILTDIESDAGRGTNGDRPYLAYPVEKAIADAIRYHGACTLAKGIEQLGKTINFAPNLEVGLDQYKKINAAVGGLRK